MTQTIIVFIVLICAGGYAAWRIYRTFKATDSKCQGCAGCVMKDEMMRNRNKNTPKKQIIDECCAKNKQKYLVK